MKPKFILILIVLSIFCTSSFAQNTFKWTGAAAGDNSWNNQDNWDNPGAWPVTVSDDVIFDLGTIIDVTNVPNTLVLNRLSILTSGGSGQGTTVNFLSFEAGAAEITVEILEITEECSLNYSAGVNLNVNQSSYFNQCSVNIGGSMYLSGSTGAMIDFGASFTANSVVNQSYMHLNQQAEVHMHCIFDNQNMLYLNDGSLIIHNSFLTGPDIYGGTSAYLELAADAVHCDPLPHLDLGTLVNNSNVNIQMNGDLVIEDVLNLQSGNLRINNNYLTLNGDCHFEGGGLDGSLSSQLEVNSGTYATNNGIDTIYLYFAEGTDTLHTLILNKPGGLLHFTSSMVISDSLYLNSGKIRFKYNSLELLSGIELYCNENNYVITDTGSRILTHVAATPSQFTFPIGTNNYYAPVTITPAFGFDDNFYVSVSDYILSHGEYGFRLAPYDNVDLTWKIESGATTSHFAAEFNWDPLAQGPGFDLTSAFIAYFNNTDMVWERLTNISDGASSGTVTGFNSQGINDFADIGLFAVSSQSNEPPVVADKEITISEDTPSGTLVDSVQISDPNTGQTLFVFPASHDYGRAFYFDHNGYIYVDSSELLHYPTLPTYKYTLNICDNGLPISCRPLSLIINLERGERDFYVTNYISPNGDNLNDYWYIDDAERVIFEVFVFNNSGDIVYKSDNYMNDWNGTSNGSNLPPGVYFYFIRSVYGDQKGTITIAR